MAALLAWPLYESLPTGRAVAQEAPRTRAGSFRPDDWITFADFRFVTSVAVATDVAYFGTTMGVERYDTLRDLWLPPVTAADGLPDGAVTALAIEPSGSLLWIGTSRGLARFETYAGMVEPAWGPPPTRVADLRIAARDGTVYAFVAGAWWSGRGGSPVLERSTSPPADADGPVPVDAIDPLDLPWTDPLYVRGTTPAGGIFRLTTTDRDARGDWYVGTWGDNGRRWGAGGASWEALAFGLAGPGGGPVVRTAGGLWFIPREGPSDAGPQPSAGPASLGGPAPAALAFAGDDGSWRYASPQGTPGLPTASVLAAAAVGDTLYLGSEHGLTRLDPRRESGVEAAVADGTEPLAVARTFGSREGVPAGSVTALAADGPFLWLGTSEGLVLWERAGETPAARYLEGTAITAVAIAADAVFVASESGLYVAERPAGAAGEALSSGTFARSGTFGRTVRAVAVRDARLVVATDAGLEVFDRSTGRWRVTQVGGGRLPAEPLSLAIDAEQVWIGTSAGLARWRPATDEWETYEPADGLAGVPVLHLLAEGDAVWASTPGGVSRFAWRSSRP